MTRLLILPFLLVAVTACGDGSAPRPADTSAPPDASAPNVPRTASERSGAHSPLASVLALGIEAPTVGDGTYRVDPFVAAYVYVGIAEGEAAAWLTATAPDAPTTGYRIVGAPDPTLLEALGLRSGDVIEELNGVPSTSAAAVKAGLQSATHEVRLTIHRDGTSWTNSYRLFGGLAWQRALAGVIEPAPADPASDVTPSDPALAEALPPTVEPAAPRPSTRAPTSPARPSASPSSSGTTRPPANPPPSTTTPRTSGVQCSTAARCTIPKALFDGLVADPHRVLAQMQIAPAIRNDVFSGYWIRGLQRGALASDLGFRVGDKITHINGTPLYDDAQAMALYFSLPQTRAFTIRYERNGTPLSKSVRVQ